MNNTDHLAALMVWSGSCIKCKDGCSRDEHVTDHYLRQRFSSFYGKRTLNKLYEFSVTLSFDHAAAFFFFLMTDL